MIYTITDFKNGNFYLEKKTTEEHIITGWATVKITTEGVEYKDSSKVNKIFFNFAEMINYFDNCKTKADEISEDDADYEFYDWIDFTKKFFKITFEEIDMISTREEWDIRGKIDDLRKEITDLEKNVVFYRDYPIHW